MFVVALAALQPAASISKTSKTSPTRHKSNITRTCKHINVCVVYTHLIYVCMYVYTHVYTSMYQYIYIYICTHACICVCMYVCMHACMYVCMYVCMYACILCQGYHLSCAVCRTDLPRVAPGPAPAALSPLPHLSLSLCGPSLAPTSVEVKYACRYVGR